MVEARTLERSIPCVPRLPQGIGQPGCGWIREDRAKAIRRFRRAGFSAGRRSLRDLEAGEQASAAGPRAVDQLVGSSRSRSWRSLTLLAATAASTTSRPASVSSMITPRRSFGSGSRRTKPRRSSRSIRLVTPADDSMSPSRAASGRAGAAGRSAASSGGRPRHGSARTGRRPPPVVWRGVVRCGTGVPSPAMPRPRGQGAPRSSRRAMVGRVVSHGHMVAEKIVLDMVSFSRETYLAPTV